MQTHPPTVQPNGPQAVPPLGVTLKTAITLAELLQRVDASTQTIGAAQYRKLVQHLGVLLELLSREPALATLLDTFPSAAAVYENLRYAQAGLCRAPLQASLDTEMQARNAIDRARSVRSAR